MDRTDVDWRGYWPAAPTPFDADGAFDEGAWRDLLGLYVDQGVHGILVNGSTGEWFSQSDAERKRVASSAVREVAGRVPVIVGVSAYTPGGASELARHAAEAGADGVLATPPPYVHPTSEEVLAFYTEVAAATDLPFMVYNWPRGVAVDLAADQDLIRRLCDIAAVVAVKDSTGDRMRMSATVESVADRARVFGSFLHRWGLAVLAGLGGDGNIDGGGLGAPYAVPAYEAFFAGDTERAAAWIDRYTALSSALVNPDYSGRIASPISQLKAAMGLLGHPGGTVRPPLLPVTAPDDLERLRSALTAAGLTPTRGEDR
ncbi:dihydrodipicolinate synthase family protein [Nocardiopsis sp. CNT312]|uniref:dihydrodipicolinate synthase family protein n=1 Tax=Nocardiopsis sp. CNT312 TaxID=1137268 RepID=UPI00048C78AB|nr:dihydrodipicolinate synthase family protein [Nocardiopsis sp. CNT312]